MSTRTADFEKVVPLIYRLPHGQYFEVNACGDDTELGMQANTQDAVSAILRVFPGVVWSKTYEESVAWWSYNGTDPSGVLLHIYAIREAPRTCRAIIEERDVEERVPVAFETRTVRKPVVVGWDCGKPEEVAS